MQTFKTFRTNIIESIELPEHEKPIKFTAKHESSVPIASLKDFKHNKIGKNTGNNGLYGVGAYVSTRNYKCGGYGKCKNNVEVELNKPFVISHNSVKDLMSKTEMSDPVKSRANMHLKLGHPHHAFQTIMRGLDSKTGNDHNINMTKHLQKLGYDGVIHHKDGEIEEASIFDNSPSRQ